MNLQEKRNVVLRKISEKYDFWHSNIESYGNWEQTQIGNEFTQEVFIEDEDGEYGDTEIIKLIVIFKDSSDEIESVYAYDEKGNGFGSYNPE